MTAATLEKKAPSTAVNPGPSRWHALWAASLGIMFDAMDASIYFMVLYPALSELLRSRSDSEIGWYGSLIMAIFMVGWALGSVVFGFVADYIGRTRTMVITILLYALCTGLCATSHSWWELALWRFLVGCGIGGEISVGAVMLSESWPGKGRIYATCAMETAFCLGYLATSLCNLGVGQSGWRWLFVVGIVPALLTLYIRMKLKEPVHFQAVKNERRRLRAKPRAELTAEERRRLRSPLIDLFGRTQVRQTLIMASLTAVAIIGYWAALSWIPAWINQLTGTAAVEERSTAGIVMNIGGLVACLVSGFWINRLGRRGTLAVGYGGSLICCLIMFLCVKSYGLGLLHWLFWVGFFTCVPFVALCIVIPEIFPTRLLGTASGFAFSAGRIFAAVAAVFGGQLIGIFGGSYAVAGAAVSTIYLAGLFFSFLIPRTTGEIAGADESVAPATACGCPGKTLSRAM